jgi:hypothetical protein
MSTGTFWPSDPDFSVQYFLPTTRQGPPADIAADTARCLPKYCAPISSIAAAAARLETTTDYAQASCPIIFVGPKTC